MADEFFDDDLGDDDLLLAADEAVVSRGSEPSSSTSVNRLHQQPASTFRSAAAIAPGPASRPAGAPPNLAPRTLQRQISIPRQQGTVQLRQGQPLRQATLFGDTVDDVEESQSYAVPAGAYRNDVNREAPTHHELNDEALRTWVYPMNLGAIRDYQYSIVKNSLFNNTLVALPTGLGKTFIAATVMLNFYRWTKKAQIVFVAPTKPLVSQQVDACFNLVGIPRSETTLLTGEISPGLRVEEWQSKRVFFMTPQTLQNDLSAGYADPKNIVLLVVDEAHRAVGEYAYAKVVKFIRRFSKSIRVLALTATPGSKIETVQEVIDNLGISHVEIRTEESLDIRQYVHRRDIEEEVLDPSDEIIRVRELFSLALKPLVDKMSQQNIYWGRDPMSLTTFGLLKTQKEWFAGPGRRANQGLQSMMRAVFGVLTSLAHSIKLLNFHGIKPFYENMSTFRSEVEAKAKGGSKYRTALVKDKSFVEMMDTIERWFGRPDFVGHPKLTVLTDRILNHFMDQSTQASSSKVIVFSEYRDSADEIVRILNFHRPMIRANIFVGQADSKRSEGMKQAQQIQTIEDFKAGKFNVLVATSIGEEGLDIGQVDLIICYDASASPIRMLQRMGRTGRKRAGRIILLLMRGKEEDNYAKSRDSYSAMQKLICEGSRFNFRFDLSTRIVPRGIIPAVDKRTIEIPVENTQVQGLPEPKKSRAPKKKKPPKKFHMPDGVITGFMKASDIGKPLPKKQKTPEPLETDFIADIPPLKKVALTKIQQSEFRRVYQLVHGQQDENVFVDIGKHPELQRTLRPTAKLRHGQYTERVVKLLSRIATEGQEEYPPLDPPGYKHLPMPELIGSSDELDAAEEILDISEDEGVDVEAHPARKRPRLSDFVSSDEGEPPTPDELGRLKRKKQQTTKQRQARNLDNDGDTCDSEEEIRGDDGDDGADLLDFIVSDSDLEMETPPTRKKKTKTVISRTRVKGDLDDLDLLGSDDMPSLSQLVNDKPAPKSNPVNRNGPTTTKDGAAGAQKPKGKNKVWLVDSDEENDPEEGVMAGGLAKSDEDVPGLTQTQRGRGRRMVADSESE
ncbi:hypothetical protein jhhlp_006533 [Lomentospora prolificans]|uniref:ATP-dependent DNA helicase n=1 Tax=Lomentospora prolificans TaxID=41688 RepID=A0A2N3N646_9PEZI|nr:hypothetical protein jhhlp_006533 [Lomentospora prolificans]